MIGTLQEHADGKLYIVTSDYDSQEPIEIRSWWPLGMKASDYKRSYGADRIGQKMYRGSVPGKYLGEDGLIYNLENMGQTYSSYVERIPIPTPKTKLEIKWRYGCWEKKTAKGWIKIYPYEVKK